MWPYDNVRKNTEQLLETIAVNNGEAICKQFDNLFNAIDRALDENNKPLFLRLTKVLNGEEGKWPYA